jgi:hypothetical protein
MRQRSSQPISASLTPLLQQRVQTEAEASRKLQSEIEQKQAELERTRERMLAYQRALELELGQGAASLSLDGITDKWKAFERFCEAHRHDGFTRPQLLRFLRDQQIQCGDGFPYKAVKAWENRLIQNGDRFFLKDGEPSPGASLPENHPRPIGSLIEAVQRVIEGMELIDTGKVYRRLKKERFEFWSRKPNSSIANILRKLKEGGKLILVREVEGNRPAQYRKTVDAQSTEKEKHHVKLLRPAN